MEAIPRHQFLVYDGSPAGYLPRLAAAITWNLQDGARCVYFNSPPMVAGIRSYLAAAGLDVAAEIEKGSLLLSSGEDHLVNGRFEIFRMLYTLIGAIERSRADGYQRIWITGDMTFEFGNEKNLAKLLDYEYALERVFAEYPCLSGVCQYHRDTLPDHAVGHALYTHKAVFVNETLSTVNPYYVAQASTPDHRPGLSSAQIDGMLGHLRRAAASS